MQGSCEVRTRFFHGRGTGVSWRFGAVTSRSPCRVEYKYTFYSIGYTRAGGRYNILFHCAQRTPRSPLYAL